METSFTELALAVRETHTIGLRTLARLVDVADPDDLETMRAREALLLKAAELLADLSPHEALVRSILRVGGLADLPGYSADVSLLRVGATGLWRGQVLDIHPLECEVRFDARRSSTRAWLSRAALIGLERPPTGIPR